MSSYHLWPVPVVLILIVLRMIARKGDPPAAARVVQNSATLLMMGIALLSLLLPNARPAYSWLVFAGLAVSLLGDLISREPEKEDVGPARLVIFLTVYLIFALGWTALNGWQARDLYTALAMLGLYGAVMFWFRPGFGLIRLAAGAYGLLTPFLVWRALSTFSGDYFSTTQAILIFGGAVLLYFADLELGMRLFARPFRFRFGTAMYQTGRLLFAVSPAFFSSKCEFFLMRIC